MKRILLDVPLWHLFLHREARGLPSAANEDQAQLSFQDELFDVLFTGEAEPVDVPDTPATRWARQVHATCAAHPDFQRLATEVRGEPYSAGLAVEKLMEQLPPPELDAPSPPALRRGVSMGAAAASAAVEEHKESMEGLAGVGGPSSATSPGSQDAGAARRLAHQLRTDARLRQIALLAGRFKRITSGKLRKKTRHGVDEVCDVELGAELSRLLPVEMMKLAHPLLRGVLVRNLTEHTAMQYQLHGQDHLGKGPLILCLDKSDSMDGPPDIWATAVALALLDVAQREKRPFGLVTFNDQVLTSTVVHPGAALSWADLFVRCHGGTDIHATLMHALGVVEQHQGSRMRHSDVVLVTDGESDTSLSETVRTKARALDVNILGIGIGVQDRALRPWCDVVHAVVDMTKLPDTVAASLVDG